MKFQLLIKLECLKILYMPETGGRNGPTLYIINKNALKLSYAVFILLINGKMNTVNIYKQDRFHARLS